MWLDQWENIFMWHCSVSLENPVKTSHEWLLPSVLFSIQSTNKVLLHNSSLWKGRQELENPGYLTTFQFKASLGTQATWEFTLKIELMDGWMDRRMDKQTNNQLQNHVFYQERRKRFHPGPPPPQCSWWSLGGTVVVGNLNWPLLLYNLYFCKECSHNSFSWFIY